MSKDLWLLRSLLLASVISCKNIVGIYIVVFVVWNRCNH